MKHFSNKFCFQNLCFDRKRNCKATALHGKLVAAENLSNITFRNIAQLLDCFIIIHYIVYSKHTTDFVLVFFGSLWFRETRIRIIVEKLL